MSFTGRCQGCLSKPGIDPGQGAQAAPGLFHSTPPTPRKACTGTALRAYSAPVSAVTNSPRASAQCSAPAPGFQSRHGLPVFQAAIALRMPALGKTPGYSHRAARAGIPPDRSWVHSHTGCHRMPPKDPGLRVESSTLKPSGTIHDSQIPPRIGAPNAGSFIGNAPGFGFSRFETSRGIVPAMLLPTMFPLGGHWPGETLWEDTSGLEEPVFGSDSGSLFPPDLRRSPEPLAGPAPGKGPLRGSLPRNEGALAIGSPGCKGKRTLPLPGPGASNLMVPLPFPRIASTHRSTPIYSRTCSLRHSVHGPSRAIR